MQPKYDLDKIKYATDYESGGVKDFEDNEASGFSAKVKGSGGNLYDVFISARHYDEGDCTCYLGQNDTLCKHMVAAAIRAVTGGKQLDPEDKRQVLQAICSGRLGELSRTELSAVKKEITSAMKYIKPYNGPSRIWFSYQNSLSEG